MDHSFKRFVGRCAANPKRVRLFHDKSFANEDLYWPFLRSATFLVAHAQSHATPGLLFMLFRFVLSNICPLKRELLVTFFMGSALTSLQYFSF